MAKLMSVSGVLVLMMSVLLSCSEYSVCEEKIGIYELKRGDFSVKFTNYGAVMISLLTPDKNGKVDDVVLGFDSPDGYKNDTTYFGAIVGRVANRIGGAKFMLNGHLHKLAPNDGKNTLHGGKKGFSDVVWKVQSYKPDSHITFTYDSFDGEEGFPGDVSVKVTYMLMETNKLGVKMEAKPLSKPTPINLALHTYWNLKGQSSGDILSHDIQLFASHITPVDDQLIPTGKISAVAGTPYDFLGSRPIGSRIDELPGGYDINYVIDGESGHLRRTAVVTESVSGRRMELWSNQVGVQFYTSNMLTSVRGKGGYVYSKYGGLCLETQGFPDSVNHENFPSQIVNPGDTYLHVMVFRFTAH
ncbi:PREDICTED: aldose 1-epimerase-like [Tarenaya hassleriana]|uniref:aldose 1-epimerase-like n=1 Tax=Tarenaya hassleriana TaxID=28532 RepID=UPI00053C0A01|nr:PREDICTED: aldose 1-epimerase-like [Tarenaya hassleriana]